MTLIMESTPCWTQLSKIKPGIIALHSSTVGMLVRLWLLEIPVECPSSVSLCEGSLHCDETGSALMLVYHLQDGHNLKLGPVCLFTTVHPKGLD